MLRSSILAVHIKFNQRRNFNQEFDMPNPVENVAIIPKYHEELLCIGDTNTLTSFIWKLYEYVELFNWLCTTSVVGRGTLCNHWQILLKFHWQIGLKLSEYRIWKVPVPWVLQTYSSPWIRLKIVAKTLKYRYMEVITNPGLLQTIFYTKGILIHLS